MRKLAFLAIPAILAVSACSSVINGTDQVVRVETAPPMAAHCYLKNARGAWDTFSTPTGVSVYRDVTPLTVSCESTSGFTGTATLRAEVDPKAVATDAASGAVAGGVVAANPVGWISGFGAAVGATSAVGSGIIDAEEGALYHYRDHVVVPMTRPVRD